LRNQPALCPRQFRQMQEDRNDHIIRKDRLLFQRDTAVVGLLPRQIFQPFRFAASGIGEQHRVSQQQRNVGERLRWIRRRFVLQRLPPRTGIAFFRRFLVIAYRRGRAQMFGFGSFGAVADRV
jgi:hypothetical protein